MNKVNNIDIYNSLETAFDVFLFLTTIPSPLTEFIFKRIVDEAYSIASVIPFADAKKQLIESMSENINTITVDINPICNFLNINRYYKDVEKFITDKNKLNKIFNKYCQWNQLPSSDDLIQCYSCYSIKRNNDNNMEWIPKTKRELRDKLSKLIDTIKDDFFDRNNTILEKNNCFHRLGYQTLFMNWISEKSPSINDIIFYNWYCKGELIDIVLDTIYRCNNDLISKTLLAWIIKQCESHEYLAKITQIRFNILRQINPQFSEQNFEYKGEKRESNTINSSVLALGTIPKSQKDSTPIDQICLNNLYRKLKEMNYISQDCSNYEFEQVFSNRTNKVQPIKWLKHQKELANFLLILRDNINYDNDYAERASRVFIKKNGDPCRKNTLYLADRDESNLQFFKEIFNASGIKR